MSGFNTIIGFMFSFLIIIGIIISAFIIYQNQISEQLQIRDFSSKLLDADLNLDISLSKPFDYSGRVGFLINVKGSHDFKLKNSNGINCLDIYLNGVNFLSHKDYFVAPLYDISKDYRLIKGGEKGILFLKNKNLSDVKTVKIISCEGKIFNFNFESTSNNWWNEIWLNKKQVFVKNNYNSNLNEYQVEVKLNNSNFDFSTVSKNSIRFVLNLKNDLIIDMPFEDKSQEVLDYSRFSNKGRLGMNLGSETKDPVFEKSCVIGGCFNFDGNDDLISIPNSNSLLLDNQFSVFSWVKWRGNGNSLQNIFTNGGWYNALRIVNDGSSNQNKTLFELNIGGTTRYLYSNSKINDDNWHFIGGVYNGKNMKIYIDGKLDAISPTYSDNIIYNNDLNYIGAESDGNYNFNGYIDELKLFDIALTDDEVKNLYFDYIFPRVLDYDIVDFNLDLKKADIFVKIPRILDLGNITFDIYSNYKGSNIVSSKSSIKNTFSYFLPRLTGAVVLDRIASNTGISLMSLSDNNRVIVGSNSFNLNNLDSKTISTSNLNKNDLVYMKDLTQVEGNGNTDDIIVPISYSGKNFYYRGFRSGGNSDTFCMLSLFGDANVEIRDGGSVEWSGVVNSSGTCAVLDIGTNNNLAINSSIPIMVSYRGGTTYDAFVFFPATNNDLYGSPSNSGLMGAGPDGANVNVLRSDGTSDNYNMGSYGTASFSSSGTSGSVAGHRLHILNSGLIGAIQQADHDGTESTVFVSKRSFSTKFGSTLSNEYITLVSDVSNANCSVYNSSNDLVANVLNGVGDQKIFKYDFDTGNDNTFISGKWYVQCDKPVWGYYEEDSNGDETNMIGYRQLRQYVYPAPSVIVN